ncbi:ER membrane protein complex subunit 3 [Vanrija pseudolonga]|uniref:ER membrane protein complex subunit 3 n=1 Tax=Vanrija pseudolonga TaxID=143232 RepID=A0AAF0YDX9_9TREE|nr:ER membrane protein complex subunit 3 [Vanrija pseudolonga]
MPGLKEQDLYLDPSIRDWVLVPITLIMVLVGLLRHYVTLLLNSAPKKQPKAAVREQRMLGRSQLLRASSPQSPLPPAQYRAFSAATATALTSGEYIKQKTAAEKEVSVGPFDPSQMDTMMDGMKKQAVMMVPNMLIMQYINVFFSGYILIKLPFPLTLGAKSLFARDLAMPDLSVRWVSALSWYFLNLFGLNGVFKLILGQDNAAVDTRDMTATGMLAGAGGAQPMAGPAGVPDMDRVFKSEAENLSLSDGLYSWVGHGIEDRVLKRFNRA